MKTEQKLNYINKEFNTNFSSLEEVDWEYISKNNKLSESFMREFQDEVEWCQISKYQKLSKGFMKEFKDMIDWDIFLCREDMRDILIHKMIN